MPHQHHTLIFGHGECARLLAGKLSAQGFTVAIAGAEVAADGGEPADGTRETVAHWTGARLIDCQGQAGAFQVTLEQNGQRTVLQAGSIVVAEQLQHIPNYAAYGLKPSGRVLSMTEAQAMLDSDGFPAQGEGGAAHVLFLNDWIEQCHPVTAARMLRLCMAAQQQPGVRAAYMAGQLKVSEEGMEACCQAAKAAGAMFFKFARNLPEMAIVKDGRVQVSGWDDTTRMAFRMTFDYVVVDEKIAPHPALEHLSRVLRLDRDIHGFVQSDNVHRLSNTTNRRGIFAAGGARAILSTEAQQADADRVALKVVEVLSGPDETALPRVEIDTGRCARCLTCYRLCPHAAIEMTPRMTIMPQACRSCGLCAAGCPNRAIAVHDGALAEALQKVMPEEDARKNCQAFVPRLVAFCCRRSAIQAREMAIGLGHLLPPNLWVVEGVCGGTFSVHHLLKALEAGADGVIVVSCHPGNCHSEQGPRNAQLRVAAAVQALSLAGFSAERLRFHTLAANMGAEFACIMDEFAQKITSLGPILATKTRA